MPQIPAAALCFLFLIPPGALCDSPKRVLFSENWEDMEGYKADIYLDVTDVFDDYLKLLKTHMLMRENYASFRYYDYYEALGTTRGALGGFVGFLLQEVGTPHNPGLGMTQQDLMKLGLMVGAALGAAIGSVEGVAVGSSRLLWKGALIGLGIGAVGGVCGAYFGGAVYNWALFGKDLSGQQSAISVGCGFG